MAIVVRKPHVQKNSPFLIKHSCVPLVDYFVRWNTPSDPKSRRWNRMAGGPRRLIEVDRFSLWFSPVLDRCRREWRTRRYVVHGSNFHRSPAVSLRPLLRRTNFSSCCWPPFSPDEFKVNLGHETVPRLSRGGGVGGDIGLAPRATCHRETPGSTEAHPDLSVTIEPWEPEPWAAR